MRKLLPNLVLFLVLVANSVYSQTGNICSTPIIIQSLPYHHVDNTSNYGNDVAISQGTFSTCGASPNTTNYLAGNDVFYSYTATQTGVITLTMTPSSASPNSSIFVYNNCNIAQGCIGGVANINAGVRTIPLSVVNGQTYLIVISSSAATPNIGYSLLIQRETCTKPTNVSVDNTTTDSVTLTWNELNHSSWQYAIQPLGNLVPSGNGQTVNTPSLEKTGLTPGTHYQFWVRAECSTGSGIFSPWTGPYLFSTAVCNAENTCPYTFRLTDAGNNGWSTNRFQVKQNGVVVATLGAQIPIGSGPIDVPVSLCQDVPFELYFSAVGSSPNQCGIQIINPFGQYLFNQRAVASSLNSIVYTNSVNCTTPVCDVAAPMYVTVTDATFTTAYLSWTAPATTSWDIYVTSASGEAPNEFTTPTYDNVTTNGFMLTNLIEDTSYSVYVRVNCSPSPSAWSQSSSFSTAVSCVAPYGITVSGITSTSATFMWTANTPSTEWEVLIVQGNGNITPPENPTAGNGTFLFQVSNQPTFTIPDGTLSPATIYKVFVRTICSPTNKSRWIPESGGYAFNTITCAESQKCNYKFILTNANGNTWNGGRMQVKQNGILIATLGATSVNNTNGVTVALCNDIPFELYWSTPGLLPESIGIKILDSYGDEIYTKLPGSGAPLTSLYNATTNCTPPSCIKPSNLLATEITSNSALLSWTSSSDSLYDLYIVPSGGPAPQNNPSTIPTISGVSNPYTLTQFNGQPLQPSTSYTYYVRKVCSETDKSTWTIFNSVTFLTKAVNDECSSALTIPVSPNQTFDTSNLVNGNTLGATASQTTTTPPLMGVACNPGGSDVWYKFVATNTSHTIFFTDKVASIGSSVLYYSILSGNCDSLANVSCHTNLNDTILNLTVGQTYYIRVYSPSIGSTSVKFKIGIISPPSNDDCNNPVDVPVNPDLIASQSVIGNTYGATASLPVITGTGCSASDDDVWYNFIATANTHIITVTSLNPDILFSYSLLTGDCSSLTNRFCTISKTRIATNLTIGQHYKVRVYTTTDARLGAALFNLSITTPLPLTNDECINAIPIPVNENHVCNTTLNASLSGATASNTDIVCNGIYDDVWFSFVATSTSHSISLLNLSGESVTLSHNVMSGICGSLTNLQCSTAGLSSVNTNYVVGQTYYIRVWSIMSRVIPVNFSICIKSFPTCDTAKPLCGSTPDDPFIFQNAVGVGNVTGVACLQTTPNPTYYTFQVAESGKLQFEITQYESFNILGEPQGQGIDVDFVAWGPFSSLDSCGLISNTLCTSCPSNTANPNFYPYENIVDCSYSTNEFETLSIPNALAGEYYVLLITNFENDPGYIKLVQTNHGQPDAGTTLCADKIQLIAFVDSNANGIKDSNEINFPHGKFTYQKNNTGIVHNINSPIGKYNIYDSNPANTYDFGYQMYPEFASHYAVSPTTYNDINIAMSSGSVNLYFPITVTQAYSDVAVSIIPTQQPVAGFTYKNRIAVTNKGFNSVNVTVSFTKDPKLTITNISSFTPIHNQVGFSFAATALPFATVYCDVTMAIPAIPGVNIGDLLTNSASVIASNDIDSSNNLFSNTQPVVASYDPNDKMEARGEKIIITDFAPNDYLNYTIRFQNTGNYKATDIRIEDILDIKLDPASLRTDNASHNYTMEVIDNKVIWEFKGIDLPAITQSEPLSHGYINFRVKLKPGFTIGDIIPNTASIFFDSNPAIITNTFQTTFEEALNTAEFTNANILVHPNPARTTVEIMTRNTPEIIESVVLYDISGKVIKRSGNLSSVSTSLNVSDLSKGMYLMEITTQSNLKQIKKLVIN